MNCSVSIVIPPANVLRVSREEPHGTHVRTFVILRCAQDDVEEEPLVLLAMLAASHELS